MNYIKSKYNVVYKDDILEEAAICNLISGSFIVLNKESYTNFSNLKLDYFNEEQLNKLINMGFITNKNEDQLIEDLRNNLLKNEKNDHKLNTVIVTTSCCNARCFYCYENNIKKSTMNEETADLIIEDLLSKAKNKTLKIAWFGGEPLVNKNIIDYISKKLEEQNVNFYSTMISNGLLFKDITGEQLKLWRLKQVQITLDGINEEYNSVKNYPGVDNAFNVVINNIGVLIQCGVFVTIRINFNPSNIEKSLKIVDYIFTKFKNDKHLRIYFSNIIDDNVPFCLDFKNDSYVKLFERTAKYHYIKNLKDFLIKPRLIGCGIYRKDFCIYNPDGKLFKCEHSIIDDNEAYYDLKTKIKNDKAEKKWLEFKVPYDECIDCIAWPICAGGCKYYYLNKKKFTNCLQIKNSLEEIIKIYYVYFRNNNLSKELMNIINQCLIEKKDKDIVEIFNNFETNKERAELINYLKQVSYKFDSSDFLINLLNKELK